MNAYVVLNRRFDPLSEEDLSRPEILSNRFDQYSGSGLMGWEELLRHARVCLLAEAGSGKTRELRAKAAELMAEGRFAVFAPLEALDREPLGDVLSSSDEVALAAWLADGHAIGWFFLDAVDELKLTEGVLERALRRLAKSITGSVHRARIIVSSRPLDWRARADRDTFLAELPEPLAATLRPPDPDQTLIAAIRMETGMGSSHQSEDDEATASDTKFLAVALTPLDRDQVNAFARGEGLENPAPFVEALDDHRAWDFARRPMDLIDLVANWIANGRLGSRQDQHRSNIAQKLREPGDRRDNGVLSEQEAEDGAERLALAMTLTRSQTLTEPDTPPTNGVLAPASILPSWTPRTRAALLRRGLFDPATYTRVRFHHQSVQQYLAARRLHRLRLAGLPTDILLGLLVSRLYGQTAVLPSMRPIAAWLALWDDDVRRLLVSHEPQTLLALGDPESLEAETRSALLRSFVDQFGVGGWRGVNIPLDEVRRLAHPDLEPTVRALWPAADSPDAKDLLLEVIWQAPLHACADLAEALAMDVDAEPDQRAVAVEALRAIGASEALARIASRLSSHLSEWPPGARRQIAPWLFPDWLSSNALLSIIRETPEPQSVTGGFGWEMRQIANRDLTPVHATSIRHGLAQLVWDGRDPAAPTHSLTSAYSHLTPALAAFCVAAPTSAIPDPTLLWDIEVANRFGEHQIGMDESRTLLAKRFAPGEPWREPLFWVSLGVVDALPEPGNAWNRLYCVTMQTSMLGELVEADRTWLEASVPGLAGDGRLPVVLQGLLRLWFQRGRPDGEIPDLIAFAGSDPLLLDDMRSRTAPPEPPPADQVAQQKKWREERLRREAKEARHLADWQAWRATVTADPEAAFQPAKLAHTLRNIHLFLRGIAGQTARYEVWNRDKVRDVFGEPVAALAVVHFAGLWRQVWPVLWSARAERNSTPESWTRALTGLAAEASIKGWSGKLTPEDARLATGLALTELNGFGFMLEDLFADWPHEVDSVLGWELSAELAMPLSVTFLPALQYLGHGSHALKAFMGPRLLVALQFWPETSVDGSPEAGHRLEQCLSLIAEAGPSSERRAAAAAAEFHIRRAPNDALALVWLRGLVRLDVNAGLAIALEVSEQSGSPWTHQQVIAMLASLFGRHGGGPGVDASPDVIARLTRLAFQVVREGDDVKHDGVYTPGLRDHAEQAREALLSALLSRPGPDAARQLQTLIDDEAITGRSDRLLFLLREKAGRDGEFRAFSPEAVLALETSVETPARDRDHSSPKDTTLYIENMPKLKLKEQDPPFYRLVLVAVGIESYQNPPGQAEIKPVEWATKDAAAVEKTFETIFDGTCEVVSTVFIDQDASLTTLRKSLAKTIKTLTADELFVFYYAGHGFQTAGQNWLTAWDSDPDELASTSLQLAADILTPLAASDCKRALIFIDACAEDMTDASSRSLLKNLNPDEIEDYLDDGDYVGVYLSCSAGQKAWGSPVLSHGVFTWHLLQALEGKAPDALVEDRWLTDVSLRDWLAGAVSKWIKLNLTGKTQKPQAVLAASQSFRIRQIPQVVVPPVVLADLQLPNTRAYLEGVETGAIRSLDLKPGNAPPRYLSDKGTRFIADLLRSHLNEELDGISKATREHFSLARDEAKPEWDIVGGGIVAPLFEYDVSCEQIPDALDQYLIRRQLTLREGWEDETEALGEIFAMVELSTLVVEIDKRRLRYEKVANQLDVLKRSGSGVLDEQTDTKRLTYTRDDYTIVIDGEAGRVEIRHDDKAHLDLAEWVRTLDLGWTTTSDMLLDVT